MERSYEREQLKQRRLELEGAGYCLPPRIERYMTPWASVENNNPIVWQEARSWESGMGGMYLWGEEGIGKTALGRFLLTRAMQAGLSVHEFSCVAFAEMQDNRFDRAMQRRYEFACRSGVLLLDDISVPQYSKWSIDRLWNLSNERAKYSLATIITSNISSSDLYQHRLVPADPQNNQLAAGLLRRFKPFLEVRMVGVSVRKEMNYKPATKAGEQLSLEGK